MNYQSLYRKYRPTNFSEVYGQKIAKKILMNSLINKKISHAYLFFGPRGTGKTSLAKMFARICNCENVIDGSCCEKCLSCIASREKSCVDIVEIDAASNNGVDEIRELKSKVNLTPNSLKYKVYIIDEVHMLSTGAFNALLKTLEEPPQHVIFILATTEYYKVPATIVSRCQTIEFSNIDNMNMKKRLIEICQKENILIDEDAIDEIVRNSNGGLRDGIGLLDKTISVLDKNDKITKILVRNLLGNIPSEEIDFLADCILNSDLDKLFEIVQKYRNQGVDFIKIMDDLILNFRNRMVEEKKYYLTKIINLINDYQIKMKNSVHKDILFEIMIIEASNKTNVRNKEEVMLSDTENITKNDKNNHKKNIDNSIIQIRVNNSFVNADKKVLTEVKKLWNTLEKFTFDSSFGSIVCDLLDCIPVVSSDKNMILCSNYVAIVNKINENLTKYEEVLNSKLNLSQKIIAIQTKEWEFLKENYLNNIKNNIKYKYIEEMKTTESNSDEINECISNREKALELFGKVD